MRKTIMIGKNISDGDLLMAMQMMVDYEPVVYGHTGHYYNTNLYATDRNEFDEHSLDEEEGKMWIENSLNKDALEDKQFEYLKNALWMYHL